MTLRPPRLREVRRFALHLGPDERRLHLLIEFKDGERAEMGPFDREALMSMIGAKVGHGALAPVALLADPENDTLRLAYDGYRDEHHVKG